ncbi:MAG: FAD-binding oxidoreductase, partial [Hydrogenimonas sp.]|nr:FAD-binding oxidoreductase [Hydrogenimonas sp.]
PRRFHISRLQRGCGYKRDIRLRAVMFDTIVIGAGIAGVSVAYWLKEEGQSVLLVDKKGLLAGASGAAGAFLSPRLGKGGELQRITNEAYLFALEFYKKNTPHSFFQKGLARVPKDDEDAKRFHEYRRHLKIPFKLCGREDLPFLSKESLIDEAICFEEAAFVDPMGAAKSLSDGVQTIFGIDAKPTRESGVWRVGKFKAKNIVISTGAERLPIEAPYLEISGLWGERVDIKTSAKIPMTIHKRISVSANVEGVVRVGATHVRDDERSEIERVNSLIVDAIGMVPALKDQTLLRIYAGRRSSVSDHFPVVGALADLHRTYKTLGVPSKNVKPESSEIDRIEGCFIAGCYGGRGFVFAPLMGKALANKILKGEAVNPLASPDRYLLRYLRKNRFKSA